MTLLFCIATDSVARSIYRRFTLDEKVPRLVSLWSFFSEEELRLHTNHLSYRAFYMPWSRHPIVAFVTGMFLFWLVALFRLCSVSLPGAKCARRSGAH